MAGYDELVRKRTIDSDLLASCTGDGDWEGYCRSNFIIIILLVTVPAPSSVRQEGWGWGRLHGVVRNCQELSGTRLHVYEGHGTGHQGMARLARTRLHFTSPHSFPVSLALAEASTCILLRVCLSLSFSLTHTPTHIHIYIYIYI